MSIAPHPTFADLLRHYRRAAGLTQEELAERAGLSARAISSLECGINRSPHRDTVALLVSALGLTPEEVNALEGTVRRGRGTSIRHNRADVALFQRAALPIPLTPLIGREHDEAVVTHLLSQSDVRLLTLTGPAGIGKTRLALQVTQGVRASFRDGVAFVDLAPVRDFRQVLPALARALAVRESREHSLVESLRDALRTRQMLLLLDNFEQVLAGAPLLTDLLGACGELKVLVTSRAALRLRGEHEFDVPPLALPNLAYLPPLGDLGQYAAVALFVQRARAVKPSFELTQANAQEVTQICQRLDGLPLAIELAAARVKLFPPRLLLQELQRGLGALVNGPSDVPERQQTMRGAIGWSYDLLPEPQRALFRRLAVFSGGWTLEAAEAVCAAGDERRADVLAGLASLLNKSLVRQSDQPDGDVRFHMLVTLREYGLERLEEAGESESARLRHLEYCLSLAEAAEADLVGIRQARCLTLLEREHDNFRAALRWTVTSERIEAGMRLASVLWRFWELRGHLSEGRGWLDTLLEGDAIRGGNGGAAERGVRARALRCAGDLARRQGDYARSHALLAECLELSRAGGGAHELVQILSTFGSLLWLMGRNEEARPLLDESLAICREHGDRAGLAATLNSLGDIARDCNDFEGAEAYFREATALYREEGDLAELVDTLRGLGTIAHEQGQHARAQSYYEEALPIARELGSAAAIAPLLTNLGVAAFETGNFARAASQMEEALALFRELNIRSGIYRSLLNLGDVALARGEHDEALRYYRQALEAEGLTSARHHIAMLFEHLAKGLVATGRMEQAARVLGAAEALRASAGVPVEPAQRERYAKTVEAVRMAMDAQTFSVAWTAGREMTPAATLARLDAEAPIFAR